MPHCTATTVWEGAVTIKMAHSFLTIPKADDRGGLEEGGARDSAVYGHSILCIP